jgi:hypothetical protein
VNYKPAIVTAYFKECGLPEPEYEVKHIPGRKFRLDIAWEPQRIGIEVNGGVWILGKHGRGSGIVKDMEKNNLSVVYGWRVFQVQPKDLCTQGTVELVRTLMSKG